MNKLCIGLSGLIKVLENNEPVILDPEVMIYVMSHDSFRAQTVVEGDYQVQSRVRAIYNALDDPHAYLVVDESHLLTNTKNRLHKALLAWKWNIVLISATPVRNEPAELKDLLLVLDPKSYVDISTEDMMT